MLLARTFVPRGCTLMIYIVAVQSQKAVSAYFTGKQILLLHSSRPIHSMRRHTKYGCFLIIVRHFGRIYALQESIVWAEHQLSLFAPELALQSKSALVGLRIVVNVSKTSNCALPPPSEVTNALPFVLAHLPETL